MGRKYAHGTAKGLLGAAEAGVQPLAAVRRLAGGIHGLPAVAMKNAPGCLFFIFHFFKSNFFVNVLFLNFCIYVPGGKFTPNFSVLIVYRESLPVIE